MSKDCKPFVDRFFSKINKTDSCWLWTGTRQRRNGIPRYGFITKGRHGEGQMSAHRASWVIHYGEIPDGLYVCHRCDNPPCVNPDHLFLGTALDNMSDMFAKGRSGNCKLTREQADKIKTEYATGLISMRELGGKYGISHTHVRHLVIGKTGKNLKSGDSNK
jgi:hypothetical protein